MKKFKDLKFVAAICLLIACNSCSNDSSLEIIEEANTLEINSVFSKSRTTCDTSIAINYNFSPGLSVADRITFKEDYRAYMAQYFTICEVQELGGDCINSEIWRVNGREYYAADPPKYPKGGTNGINRDGDPDLDPEINPDIIDTNFNRTDYDDCFDEKEENLNNHLGGL